MFNANSADPVVLFRRHRKRRLNRATGSALFGSALFANYPLVDQHCLPITILWIRNACHLPFCGSALFAKDLFVAQHWLLIPFCGSALFANYAFVDLHCLRITLLWTSTVCQFPFWGSPDYNGFRHS